MQSTGAIYIFCLFVFWATPGSTLALYSRVASLGAGDHMDFGDPVLGTEPRSAMCKASTLLTVQSLWSHDHFYFG